MTFDGFSILIAVFCVFLPVSYQATFGVILIYKTPVGEFIDDSTFLEFPSVNVNYNKSGLYQRYHRGGAGYDFLGGVLFAVSRGHSCMYPTCSFAVFSALAQVNTHLFHYILMKLSFF